MGLYISAQFKEERLCNCCGLGGGGYRIKKQALDLRQCEKDVKDFLEKFFESLKPQEPAESHNAFSLNSGSDLYI